MNCLSRKGDSIIIDLTSFSTSELCCIYDSLNHWRWHPLLGEQPDGWDQAANILSKKQRFWNKLFFKQNQGYIVEKYAAIKPIMEEIVSIVGVKKTLQYHWVNNLGKTNEEFEKWYEVKLSNAAFCTYGEFH